MKYKILYPIFLFSLIVGAFTKLQAQTTSKKKNYQIGAYYFDGWTGLTTEHLTSALRDSFPNRKPIWGWVTSTQNIMNVQINLASDANLSFFSFCWYYSGDDYRHNPLNQALGFFLKSPNRNKLKFNLMVANHSGFIIGPDNWDRVTDDWIALFKNEQYFKLNGMPLINFFSVSSLVKAFGSTTAVKAAFDRLRIKCVQNGLSGVNILACTYPNYDDAHNAINCGFDMLSGYNYHISTDNGSTDKLMTIDSLQNIGQNAWNYIEKSSNLPFFPVATLNWDPKPWASVSKSYAKSFRFKGYSSATVYRSVKQMKRWIDLNRSKNADGVGFIYAWNEYGEGAWLTPTKTSNNVLLKAVKRALN